MSNIFRRIQSSNLSIIWTSLSQEFSSWCSKTDISYMFMAKKTGSSFYCVESFAIREEGPRIAYLGKRPSLSPITRFHLLWPISFSTLTYRALRFSPIQKIQALVLRNGFPLLKLNGLQTLMVQDKRKLSPVFYRNVERINKTAGTLTRLRFLVFF